MTQRMFGFVLIALVLVGAGYYAVRSRTTTTPPATEAAQPIDLSNTPSYSLADVSSHTSSSDCWMAIDGKVYDVTEYIASGQHNPEIVRGCGLDASQMFSEERKHSRGKAQALLPGLVIGTLKA